MNYERRSRSLSALCNLQKPASNGLEYFVLRIDTGEALDKNCNTSLINLFHPSWYIYIYIYI